MTKRCMKAGLIVVGYKPQIFLDKQAEFHDRLERGLVKAEDLHELGELLNGKCRGRESDQEITFFKNNTGMGIQFAATARKDVRESQGERYRRRIAAGHLHDQARR